MFAVSQTVHFLFHRFRRISNLVCEIPILVRIYVIQGINLRSRDIFSYSDAFIKIDYGGQTISDRAHYVPNQTSPIFGKRFQMSGIIPKNNLLKVSVFDRDSLLSNDLIGTTIIDLEDRVRSKYGATCGIAKEYNAIGYNTWRNSMLPSQILHKLCNDMELLPPQYTLDKVILAGIEFKDTSEITKDGNIKERLALSVLNNFERVDGVGHKLVPEHVETRSLYRDDRPGVEQGKLMLWIELFDPRKSIPEPVDITPIPPRPYELRVIIWNVHDVILDEKNIFGKSMSDIYVKGYGKIIILYLQSINKLIKILTSMSVTERWLDNIDDSQYTDIHYRSLTGEGNFNWRMIFPLKYSIGEDVVI